jgi:hypothetical protein
MGPMSGTCLFITNFQLSEVIFRPHPQLDSRFIITKNGYIVDMVTSRTLSRAPPSHFEPYSIFQSMPVFAGHEGTFATDAAGQLIIVRFPSAVQTGSDTRPVSTRDVAKNAEEVNDLLPLEIFYKRAGKRKAVKTSSTDVP